VSAEWSVSSTGRRVRVYRLTAVGRRHLAKEVSAFEQMLEAITRVMARGES
jgi:DNA-binding PadR family transcriptional regulator